MQTIVEDGERREITPEEIAAENTPERVAAEEEYQAGVDAALIVEAEIITEISASPLDGITFAQVDTYIDNQVTDLASAKAVLKKLSRAILILNKKAGI